MLVYQLENPEKFNAMLASTTHYKDFIVTVSDILSNEPTSITFTRDEIVSCRIYGSLYDEVGVGNAISRQCKLTLHALSEQIPAGAQVTISTWLVDGAEVSEIVPQGRFFVDTREVNDAQGTVTLWCFDEMLKTDLRYPYATKILGDIDGDGKVTTGDWRMATLAWSGNIVLTDKEKLFADIDGDGEITATDVRLIQLIAEGEPYYTMPSAFAVKMVAEKTGIVVDDSVYDYMLYPIDFPGVYKDEYGAIIVEEDTSCRDVLKQVGMVNCGNFCINNKGLLTFIPLHTDKHANIIVDYEDMQEEKVLTGQSYLKMYWTGIDYWSDGFQVLFVGNRDGRVLRIDLLGSLFHDLTDTAAYALDMIFGTATRGFSMTNAIISPAAELGDVFDYKNDGWTTRPVISDIDITLDTLYSADISTPNGIEGESEYANTKKLTAEEQRAIAKTAASAAQGIIDNYGIRKISSINFSNYNKTANSGEFEVKTKGTGGETYTTTYDVAFVNGIPVSITSGSTTVEVTM